MNSIVGHVLRGTVIGAVLGAAQAQTPSSVNTTPSRETLDEVSQDGCKGVSVVVRRCVPAAVAGAAQGSSDKPGDALTRSRARTKAGFDRRDRRAREDASENRGDTAAGSGAQRLAPVIVTGKAAEAPLSIEEVLQRALDPQGGSPGGTVTTYGPDGTRTECVARCKGPMCCITLRSRPDPARESNSIGR